MGYKRSLGRKVARVVSNLTSGLLNPISDEPSRLRPDEAEMKAEEDTIAPESECVAQADGPDTSSFTAFLRSLLLSSDDSDHHCNDDKCRSGVRGGGLPSNSGKKISNLHRTLLPSGGGRKVLGKAVRQGVDTDVDRCGYQVSADEHVRNGEKDYQKLIECEMKTFEVMKGAVSNVCLPDISEHSLLLSDATRGAIYLSLPALIHELKWVLLYSTWRHGISLSTLYRRSMPCPGYCLLVVGDRKGAVFGGLLEAPLNPTNKRKYQGTPNSFLFTDVSKHLVVFRPTGANRYFTLCSTEFIALGGGGHFALYLDGDLLSGSSSASETFGNSCLAHTPEFEVKEVELWGFTYTSKYGQRVAPFHPVEATGLYRW